ncbi:MAG: hypothetical protein RI949_469 [Pseudomonadota bacterium]|jgi:MFS family permease
MTTETPPRHSTTTVVLLHLAHAVDHLFLLIFATTVSSMAPDFGFTQWQDLMPFGVGAFILFGLGSIPAGRLGDLWGRRQMMIVFFVGMGVSALAVSLTQSAWQLALALTLMGAFASIYHPVGIPMLLQTATRPGLAVGLNGLSGNLGVAVAAALTGLLVQVAGWRWAYALPGVTALALGAWFALTSPPETMAPAKRKGGPKVTLTPAQLARLLLVMTIASSCGSVIFNVTTNGNAQLLAERFKGLMEDPARLGLLLAALYALASLAQVVVGRLLDRMALKPLYLIMSIAQLPFLLLEANTQGWWFYAFLVGTTIFMFGAVPFTDTMIVRYIEDGMRSRVTGMRLAMSLSVSSFALWVMGPLVKSWGFSSMLWILAGFAALATLAVLGLPKEPKPVT